MRFSSRKAVFVISALACGLVAALAWHSYKGAIEGRRYPFDTFLFLPHLRFSDFYDVISASANWDPYSRWAIYLPFTYVVMHPFSWIPAFPAYLLYLAFTVALLFRAVFRILATSMGPTPFAALTAAVMLCCSCPFIVCVDRGNIEITLMWLMCECVYRMRSRHFAAGLVYLVPAICMKIYPAVLLVMLLPSRRWKLLAASLISAVAITAVSLSLFTGTMAENFTRWRSQAEKFNTLYVIGNYGMGGTASVWNAVKLLAIQQQIYDQSHDPLHAVQDFTAHLSRLLWWCMCVLGVTGVYLVYHIVVVEPSYWRRAALLIVFMVLATPAGAEYKVVHAITSLACLIATAEKRPGDWCAVALITLALIPKKYYYFPHIVADSGIAECSLAVLLNPLLLVAALAVIVAGGWVVSIPVRRAARIEAILRVIAPA